MTHLLDTSALLAHYLGEPGAMDVLIAATAAVKNATLVHRDPHFAAVPGSLLKQEVLPAK